MLRAVCQCYLTRARQNHCGHDLPSNRQAYQQTQRTDLCDGKHYSASPTYDQVQVNARCMPAVGDMLRTGADAAADKPVY